MVHRAVSLANIKEVQSNASAFRPRRVYSSQSIIARKTSLVGTKKCPNTQRRTTLSNFDDLNSVRQPHRERLLVDIQDTHRVSFIFPPSANSYEPVHEALPTKSLSHRKSHTYAGLRVKTSNLTPLRSQSVKDLSQADSRTKIPLYVPARNHQAGQSAVTRLICGYK